MKSQEASKANAMKIKRDKIESLITNFEEKELDFVIRVIKNMKSIRDASKKSAPNPVEE